MLTAVPSRFAVLSIEDDDYKPKKTQKPVNSKTTVKPNNKKENKPKVQPKKDDKKKQQNKQKKKKSNPDGQQWEQWKQKDFTAVEETYEHELHEAILLSKLSYQEAQVEEKCKNENKENIKKNNSKKAKKSTMSLEEFNNLDMQAAQTTVPKKEPKGNPPKEEETEFFEKVDKEATLEVEKEKEKAALKIRSIELDNNITFAQLKDEIEKRDTTIKELREEIESLKEELGNVRHRNKKLYQILQQGEMKDKAAVLAEVTKLQEIRDELTTEVTSLHAQLEQERSKPRVSSTDNKSTKQNNKKRLASDNA